LHDSRVNVQIFGEMKMALDRLAFLRRQRGKIFSSLNKNGDARGVNVVGDTTRSPQQHGR
jgi:hypothetical protein